MLTMHERIETKLREAFNPEFLDIVNDSCKHKGHAGDDGSGQSHFSIIIRSSDFSGVSRVKSQRMLLSVIKEEVKHIHAIAISAKSEK